MNKEERKWVEQSNPLPKYTPPHGIKRILGDEVGFTSVNLEWKDGQRSEVVLVPNKDGKYKIIDKK